MRLSKGGSGRGGGDAAKGFLAALLLVAGLGWIVYKGNELGLGASGALKPLLLGPSAVLFVLASLVAFPDPRRRLGASFLGIGLLALFWLSREPGVVGWTLSTPFGSLGTGARASVLKGPRPELAAVATLLTFAGAAILARRSWVGGLLLGASLWCALCLDPRGWAWPRLGVGTRGTVRSAAVPFDRTGAVLPALLGLAGIVALAAPSKGKAS